MLEKPDIADASIVARLRTDYRLPIVRLTFLPLGFDLNAAVYRATTDTAASYFVKLRRRPFDSIAVTLPRHLSDHGMRQIIAPVATDAGKLWTDVGDFTLMVYPFIEGRTGREIRLSDVQWNDFGAALKQLHTAAVPVSLMQQLPRLGYSPKWRDSVKSFVAAAGDATFVDPVAIRVEALLRARRDEILEVVGRADRLAGVLQRRAPEVVVCHSDVHASNLLIESGGALYLVDWDGPLLAPKERDLMFVGGGQGFVGYTAEEEEALFYHGYGRTQVDGDALMYYRCERIIEDIALACEQLLSSADGGVDRELSLQYLEANFMPGGTVEHAFRATNLTKGS